MPFRHRLLAALVAVIWGVNFLAIHASLAHFPPFLLAALRWTLLAIPTVLLVPPPRVRLRHLLGYGAGFGVLQFLFLYWGMADGMPAGLASLVLQCSAPFTVVLGAVLTGEHLTARRAAGVAIAVGGLVVVGSQRTGGAGLWPFLLVVLGGLGWALGNLASRAARAPNPLHFTMWMTVVPPVPMFATSLVFEGPGAIADALVSAPDAAWALIGLAYTCLVATVVGSGLWTWLLARHPAGAVAPFSMLVPVTGLASAAVVLGERPAPLEWLGCAIVVTGVLWGAVSTTSQSARPTGPTGPTSRRARPGRATV